MNKIILISLFIMIALLPAVFAEYNTVESRVFNTTFNVSINDTSFSITTEQGTLYYNFSIPLNASYNLGIVRLVNVSYNGTVVSNVSFNLTCPVPICNFESVTSNITSYIDLNIRPTQVRLNELEAKRIIAEDNLLFAKENASIYQREYEVCQQRDIDSGKLLDKEQRYNGWLYMFGALLLLAILVLIVFYVKGMGGLGDGFGKQTWSYT